jgi:hypothetical protein
MSVMDTAEGWKKLYCIIQSDFALHQMHQRTDEEWNDKLKSLGGIFSEERPWYGIREGTNPNGTITMSNPAGGWIQIPLDTAEKIITLGLP